MMVSVPTFIRFYFSHFYLTKFILFISVAFSALFHGGFSSTTSDNSEKTVSNTFGNRVDFFLITALKVINSCAALKFYRQQQEVLRLNSKHVLVDDIAIDEMEKSIVFEKNQLSSYTIWKNVSCNRDEFHFKNFNDVKLKLFFGFSFVKFAGTKI